MGLDAACPPPIGLDAAGLAERQSAPHFSLRGAHVDLGVVPASRAAIAQNRICSLADAAAGKPDRGLPSMAIGMAELSSEAPRCNTDHVCYGADLRSRGKALWPRLVARYAGRCHPLLGFHDGGVLDLYHAREPSPGGGGARGRATLAGQGVPA